LPYLIVDLKLCNRTEVDNPGDDWYTTLTDFLDTYTYDDTEEIQNELDRKRMPYQRFERKKRQ
ncbi:TPA: hypothetical protein LP832_002454, partial [Enterococcus faecium]|nr:hypothetical protein [Enterococcus faecium]